MKKINLFLILLVISVLSISFGGTAAAQDVDVSTMSNEELMVLLQSIMQKLEQESAAETEDKDAEIVETSLPIPAIETPEATVSEEKAETFSIYENKKLVIGRMPDSWFIRIDPDGNNNGEDGGSDGGGFHYGGNTYPDYGGVFTPPDVWILW